MKTKNVRVVAEVEWSHEVPENWNDDDVLFHLNGSSWCSANFLERLKEQNPHLCICAVTEFKMAGTR